VVDLAEKKSWWVTFRDKVVEACEALAATEIASSILKWVKK